MERRPYLIAALGLLLVAPAAGEAGPEPSKPGAAKQAPAKAKKKLSLVERLAEEKQSWTFRTTPGRDDVFIDLEALMNAQRQAQQQMDKPKVPALGQLPTPTDKPTEDDKDKLLTWAKGEETRVRQLVAARRYEDALRACDAVVKPLEAYAGRADVAAVLVSIRTYRGQAEEAKIRDEAQAAFDGLKIRILGILWSQEGARFALIEGENRALGINDRVRDTVIVNIDQDRVDFRFHYNRRRFEFPCYVDRAPGGAPKR
jgi:hypothetical protein